MHAIIGIDETNKRKFIGNKKLQGPPMLVRSLFEMLSNISIDLPGGLITCHISA